MVIPMAQLKRGNCKSEIHAVACDDVSESQDVDTQTFRVQNWQNCLIGMIAFITHQAAMGELSIGEQERVWTTSNSFV